MAGVRRSVQGDAEVIYQRCGRGCGGDVEGKGDEALTELRADEAELEEVCGHRRACHGRDHRGIGCEGGGCGRLLGEVATGSAWDASGQVSLSTFLLIWQE
ncbi:putative formin-like protein 7 [Iris pallida]|uniref:Formin-like protein 7 n=1 Tax=Iris pallida TaxID=29817 RepID=A0AAX6H5X0_IRIPA|nr:putative formin-like protein 7 [Iris pallida]KAJ6835941.1 putative formin-like protein 7 [Iris pallida]